MRIAFDIGGVIIDRNTNNYMNEAIMSLQEIIKKFKNDNVYIISKARDKYVIQNRLFFEETQFYERTGFLEQNLYFVPEYEDKQFLCNKLKINYLVDDSIKVLRYFDDNHVTKCIWFGMKNNDKYKCVSTWKSIRKFFQKIKKTENNNQ